MKKEKLLKAIGFKKKWLKDKSGYWWQLKFSKDLKLIADLDMNFYYLEIRTYQLQEGKWKKSTFETCKHFKCLENMLLWLQNQLEKRNQH